MGRRSINTTKSGKYMNPTDQARKEARKKELKKNKRQRQMVRAAVLKNKDPSQILEEMEKIDEMEYNVLQPSPLNEKVLRDKRKKLKETFDRVMRLYHNDEPEHWAELKRKEYDYEKKRLKKQQYYESVKHAQSVQIDEIPLPAPVTTANTSPSSGSGANGSQISSGTVAPFAGGMRVPPPPVALALPPFAPGAPPGVAKNSEHSDAQQLDKTKVDDEDKDWLGVPPGPPPDLLAMSELDSDAEGNSDYDGGSASAEKRRSPSQLQQRMLAMSGQNIDDFMKEMEHVHKRKHRKLQSDAEEQDDDEDEAEDKDKDKTAAKANDSASDTKSPRSSSSSSDEDDDEEEPDDDDDDDDLDDSDEAEPAAKELLPKAAPAAAAAAAAIAPPAAPTLPPIPLPPVLSGPPQQLPLPMHALAPPPSMLFRPPPLRPPGGGQNFGMRMPSGPPPPGSRPPHSLGGPGPGPMAPRMGMRMPPGPPPGLPPPSRMPHHLKHPGHVGQVGIMPIKEPPAKGVTTITAKPQIRNLSADVTRFVPSTLRVKREDQRRPAHRPKHMNDAPERAAHAPSDAHKPPTKDDAYLQFMNEMQGLL